MRTILQMRLFAMDCLPFYDTEHVEGEIFDIATRVARIRRAARRAAARDREWRAWWRETGWEEKPKRGELTCDTARS